LQAGLSLQQVAEPLVTRTAIWLIEKGRARPSRRTLRLIARRTGKPLSYFLPRPNITPEQRSAVDHLEHLVTTQRFADAVAFGVDMLTRDPAREIEAQVRFLVGRAYVRLNDGRSAYPHLQRARKLYEATADEARLADVLNQTACALHLSGDPHAVTLAYQALEACESLSPHDAELTARTLMVLGMIFVGAGAWDRAAECYEHALEASKEEPNLRNMAMAHDNLTVAYQGLNMFGEALEHARKATKYYQSSSDPTDQCRVENNLGYALLKQGELEAARLHLEVAHRLCLERDLRRYLYCAVLLSLGELHLACSELPLARERLAEAIQLAQSLNEPSNEAKGWRLQARLHTQEGELDDADVAFDKATTLFASLNVHAEVFDVCAEHSDALGVQGRLDEALGEAHRAIAAGRYAIARVRTGGMDLAAYGLRE
jgi:tetratricopeptide (TPR) repeat protein